MKKVRLSMQREMMARLAKMGYEIEKRKCRLERAIWLWRRGHKRAMPKKRGGERAAVCGLSKGENPKVILRQAAEQMALI